MRPAGRAGALALLLAAAPLRAQEVPPPPPGPGEPSLVVPPWQPPAAPWPAPGDEAPAPAPLLPPVAVRADPERTPPPVEPGPRRTRFTAALVGGYRLMSLDGIFFQAGEVAFSCGAQLFGKTLLGGELRFSSGATAQGLEGQSLSIGFQPAYLAGRFRLGGGIGVGLLIFHRASGSGSFLGGFVGLNLSAAVEVLRFGDFAALVGLRAGADIVGNDTYQLSLVLQAGIRY